MDKEVDGKAFDWKDLLLLLLLLVLSPMICRLAGSVVRKRLLLLPGSLVFQDWATAMRSWLLALAMHMS